MRKLLPLLLLFAGSAFGQQLVNCTATAPCTTTGPSVTRTGDAAYIAFGKLNADILALPSELFSSQLAQAHGGTGSTSLAGASIPVFTGSITSGDCVQWISAVSIGDSGATCGSGGSSSTFSSITSSTNVAAAMLVGSGASLAPTGTGTIKANLLATGFVASISNGGTGASTLAAANIPVQTGAITTGHCVQWASATSITDGGACGGSSFISGTFTSTQVIATYPPASNAGATVLTTDMGLMACDGTRWKVIGTPPVPPGAQVLSYNHNVFTVFPTVADLGSGNTPGQYRIYSGYLGLNTSEPPINSTTFSTDTNGQLELHYTGVANGSGVFTVVPFHTSALSGDYGQLGLAVGNRGFYVEIAETESSNDTDIFDAFFVEPQEHNPIFSDANPAFPTNYEQWHEFDVNESGHGTDRSGAYRGAYLQWANWHNGAFTLASAPAIGATTITLPPPGWQGDTASSSHPWSITFNSGESRTAVLVHGSTGPFTLSSALLSAETTAASVGSITLLNSSVTDTVSLDYTVEHIFGASYDPVGQTYNIWQDGVFQGSVSTANANSANAFRDALHYMIVVNEASHGSSVLHTRDVRYISMWTP